MFHWSVVLRFLGFPKVCYAGIAAKIVGFLLGWNLI